MMLYTDNSRGRNGAKDPAVVKFHENTCFIILLCLRLVMQGKGGISE